jgi:DNA primase large subunit
VLNSGSGNMDKILLAIFEANSCEDLFEALERSLHEIELGSLLTSHRSFDDIFKMMFQEYPHDIETGISVELSLPNYVYLTLAILSIALGDMYIHKFALRFSRIFRAKFLKSLDDENIVHFSQRIGIRLEYSGSKCFKEIQSSITKNDSILTICYRYRLPISDYLRIARKLFTEYPWRLSSLILGKGYVYLDNREKILRLISEQIYNIINTKLKNIRSVCGYGENIKTRLLNILREFDFDFTEAIEKFIQNLSKSELNSRSFTVGIPERTGVKTLDEISKITTVDELVSISQKLFPPCIRDILESLLRGENLSHHQRFAIATFLINLSVDIELMIKLFSRSPDFNEKIARYQIEHLAGLRGSKKRYFVYSCNTMKTLGMCKADCGIKNPILYLRKVLATSKDRQKDS